MATRGIGTFVVPWVQVELDGLVHSKPTMMKQGSSFRWLGEYYRLDGPAGVLPLTDPIGEDALRARAQRRMRQRLDHIFTCDEAPAEAFDDLPEASFVLSDGVREWVAEVVDSDARTGPLCVFYGTLPAANAALWIVRPPQIAQRSQLTQLPERGVVCFTPGTKIATASGSMRVEDLQEGDFVQTADNGLQPILWTATRRISGARLRATPDLAPVLIQAGALGCDQPDDALLVSPDHRIVLHGARARALFGTDEVLATARDLVDGIAVHVDRAHSDLYYTHLALPQHEVIFANGVACESFHPLSAGLESLQTEDRARLLAQVPDLHQGEDLFGAYARRMVSRAEAVIMRGDAGMRVAGA